jgi:hypothetical protein
VDATVDIFERIETFFRRLEEYAEVPTTGALLLDRGASANAEDKRDGLCLHLALYGFLGFKTAKNYFTQLPMLFALQNIQISTRDLHVYRSLSVGREQMRAMGVGRPDPHHLSCSENTGRGGWAKGKRVCFIQRTRTCLALPTDTLKYDGAIRTTSARKRPPFTPQLPLQ